MAVFLKLVSHGRIITEIGPGGLLHSLFSTIAVRLEGGRWGSRFPVVMGDLYQGAALGPAQAARALQEWREVQSGLSALPPSDMVWDYDARAAKAPWGDGHGPHVTSMANHYFTPGGLDIVKEIGENLECVVDSGGTLQFVSAPSHGQVP